MLVAGGTDTPLKMEGSTQFLFVFVYLYLYLYLCISLMLVLQEVQIHLQRWRVLLKPEEESKENPDGQRFKWAGMEIKVCQI